MTTGVWTTRVILFISTIALLALWPTMAAAGPTIAIYTDADSYALGDVIEVSLSGENYDEAMNVDVYVGLIAPGVPTYTLGESGWSGFIGPWICGIHVPNPFFMGRVPFKWFGVPSEIVPIGHEGQYYFASVLTRPGTSEYVCDLSLAPFEISCPSGSDVYVDSAFGDDSSDGSENAPWQTITYALASVDASESHPVTIHVAAGKYAASTNGESFPLNMKSWVSLCGEDRETTILDAENEAPHVITCFGMSSFTIKEFTITGGHADSWDWPDHEGAGIFCWLSSPVIQNNTITKNWALGGNGGGGGGIYCSGWATIANNTISDNETEEYWTYGGGIYCSASATITDNLIIGNRAGGGGGGGLYTTECSPDIIGNTIAKNFAGSKGGGVYCWFESPSIMDNTIRDNSTDGDGGGISCFAAADIFNNRITDNSSGWHGGGIYCQVKDAVIRDNVITGNSAGLWSDGGGINCDECSPFIQSNTIMGNSAGSQGGGIHCRSSDSAVIDNNLVTKNTGDEGAGISCMGSYPTISNCTIADNFAIEPWDIGAGIWTDFGQPTITNCIIWGHEDDLYDCSATYCCVEDDHAGAGNIHDNPMFVIGPFGDYYLDPDSPCIDAGSRSAEEAGLSDTTTRADGTPDTGTVDMGFHYPLP
ncbi:right-handed parallel beta-helix repeat-containing protein [bacterium]|nr:right-handed parallel beta-helix repeat-containing protein [bacterium]